MFPTSPFRTRPIWLLALAGAVACTDGSTDKSSGADDPATSDTADGDGDEDTHDTDDSAGDGATPCDEGLEVGQCPPDISLIDGAGDSHVFSDYQGGPLLLIGTAEW